MQNQFRMKSPEAKNKKKKTMALRILPLLSACLLWGGIEGHSTAGSSSSSIIPKPAKVEARGGFFLLGPKTRIIVAGPSAELRMVGEDFASGLRRMTGFPLEMDVKTAAAAKNSISLRLRQDLKNPGDEGYILKVEKTRVEIEALSPAGVFYGIQTLYQLLPAEAGAGKPEKNPDISLPCVRIEDKPRFRWRGVHLDVSRHFFPKEFVMKYIDIAAGHKLNTFHWHLTEDQGWRLEVKKYPRLTEFGAWRRETMFNGRPHGGFYTQEDIREVVEYAKHRFITVVPEIEMPGHAQAALAAYPELSCSGGPFHVGMEWGIIYDVFCAGNEKTFALLEDVLSEVIDLFPGEYIHIGGDEVPKLRWKNCVKCQERIRAEGLKNEEKLQSYFIKRIEKFLSAKGKRLIGWDEILEGGLAPNATVMSWRGTVGGVEAAKSGHDVVMSPTSHCYFDYYQGKYNEPKAIGGFLPLETVYGYEPVPQELTAEEAKHILGAQANVWTEYMPNSEQVEYMLMPRLCALAELVWSEKGKRDFADFQRRLVPHYDRLAAADVNFRVPPPEGMGGRKTIFEPFVAAIANPLPNAEIRYTLDGSEPTKESLLYKEPLKIESTLTLSARTVMPNGRMSRPIITVINRVDPEANGLEYKYYEGEWDRLPDFAGLASTKEGVLYDVSLENVPARQDNFGLLLQGFLQIDLEGEYRFTLNTDEAGRLLIGGKDIVPVVGPPWLKERTGTVFLPSGKHPLKIIYAEKTGNQWLEVYMEGPQTPRQLLPPGRLFRK